MRKVERYCLQKFFIVLLLFCTMVIGFYTLNSVWENRDKKNLSEILNLIPNPRRTAYVQDKVWHSKYNFLQKQETKDQETKDQELETPDYSFWASLSETDTETKNDDSEIDELIFKHTGIRLSSNKSYSKNINNHENINPINDDNYDLLTKIGLLKTKNSTRVLHLNTLSKPNKIGENKSIVQENDNLKDGHNPPQHVFGSKAISLNDSVIPVFNSSEHKTQVQNLLMRGQRVLSVDCRKLIEGDPNEVQKAKSLQENIEEPKMSTQYLDIQTENCETFRRKFGYITSPLTEEERDFPLAYSILMYKDVLQVERLLQAIYRPQNSYCIHVDAKAKPAVRNSMKRIVRCFQNVFLTPRSVDVRWGAFSVLEPELICMEELWGHKKWRYFINLTGQEFPLKTNYELVQILKAYNGSNDLEGTVRRANLGRWRSAGPPPHGIRATKGAVHIIVQRGFVDYILHSKVAQDLLDWVKKTDVPDETFFSSLNHNPHLKVPGSYLGTEETGPKKPFLARYKLWAFENSPFHGKCQGKWVHAICIFGVKDLTHLTNRTELFANKFHNNFHPITQDCLKEWIANNTRDYFFNSKTFNTSFYQQLDFVKNKV